MNTIENANMLSQYHDYDTLRRVQGNIMQTSPGQESGSTPPQSILLQETGSNGVTGSDLAEAGTESSF